MSTAEELQAKGVQQFQQHNYEAAAQTFHQAHSAYQEAGQADMAAEMLVNIGLVHRSLNEYQPALDAMQKALNFFQEQEDALRTAKVLGNMGGVYAGLNDKEQAYSSYRQAADIFDELGEKELHGETLVALGSLQVRDGKITQGSATYSVGLEQLGQLSTSQKVIRGLTGIVNRITGGK